MAEEKTAFNLNDPNRKYHCWVSCILTLPKEVLMPMKQPLYYVDVLFYEKNKKINLEARTKFESGAVYLMNKKDIPKKEIGNIDFLTNDFIVIQKTISYSHDLSSQSLLDEMIKNPNIEVKNKNDGKEILEIGQMKIKMD